MNGKNYERGIKINEVWEVLFCWILFKIGDLGVEKIIEKLVWLERFRIGKIRKEVVVGKIGLVV